MNNLTLKLFLKQSGLDINKVIELGCGNGEDSHLLLEFNAKEIISIDKKAFTGNQTSRIKFIEADYFDIENIKNEINDDDYDLVFSCYSLCFNTQQHIEENLPFYLAKIKKGGTFYILDFTAEEQVVTKRTNLLEKWFFSILSKHFKEFQIKTEEVYEEAHKHTHNIFELTCFNKL